MTGKIISLTPDIVDVRFAKGKIPTIGTLLKTQTNGYLSVEAILNTSIVRAVVITRNIDVALGESVVATNKPLQVPVGKQVLGRILDVFGNVIDGGAKLPTSIYKDVVIYKNDKNSFTTKGKRLETGIRVVDFFLPIFEGDKLGMFGGAGVGKTLVIKEIINNLTIQDSNAKSIFVGIGERSREAEELYRELKESNLLSKVALIFAQMNDTPGARMKVIYPALTLAEHFRDVEQQNIFMFIDNIYRFTQAGSEVSSSLGRIPAQSGYQPTLQTEISIVQERIANSSKGTITAFETVFVPADDITDPSVVAIFSHLDSSMVLDRSIAAEGRYPAISPLHSSSNNLVEDKVGRRHVDAVKSVKFYLQRQEELKDLINILGQDGLSDEDKKSIQRARILTNYFTQNFFVSQIFTGRKGVHAKISETIDAVERIANGEFDDVSPTNFLYLNSISSIDQKIELAKRQKEDANKVKSHSKIRKHKK